MINLIIFSYMSLPLPHLHFHFVPLHKKHMHRLCLENCFCMFYFLLFWLLKFSSPVKVGAKGIIYNCTLSPILTHHLLYQLRVGQVVNLHSLLPVLQLYYWAMKKKKCLQLQKDFDKKSIKYLKYLTFFKEKPVKLSQTVVLGS